MRRLSLIFASSLICSVAFATPHADASLVPRRTFFGNADRAGLALSPDGTQLAFIAPVAGVQNIWVAPLDNLAAARPLTADKGQGITNCTWTFTGKQLLYSQDRNGDENAHAYLLDVTGAKPARDLTPSKHAHVASLGLDRALPNEVLLGLHERSPQYADYYRIDLSTGKRRLVFKNDAHYDHIIALHLEPRIGHRQRKDGVAEYVDLSTPKAPPLLVVPVEDQAETGIGAFNRAGTSLYYTDSRGRNTAALFKLDLATKKATLLAEDPQADVEPGESEAGEVATAISTYAEQRRQFIDPKLKADFDYLATIDKGEITVHSKSLDESRWIVSFGADDAVGKYYLYDRGAQKHATFLFHLDATLAKVALSPRRSRIIKARDGLNLVSYLTVPRSNDPDGDGVPDRPLPMVLYVHGGPWSRDEPGFDITHQWLASRGYAVLSVNFRASTGFGKAFGNAGDREWGGKMHDDLIDAVNWAIKEHIADPQRVAIMGASYGGYAALTGLTMTPDTFACAVDEVGPSNLETLINSFPQYYAPDLARVARQVGDVHTSEGRAFLASRSPLGMADRIKRPLLILQGVNDPRVKQAESDRIVNALQAKHIPVTYVLYPDEGHGFGRPENQISSAAVQEIFLAHCLDGVYEPIGDDFAGSSINVPVGAEHIPGVAAALPSSPIGALSSEYLRELWKSSPMAASQAGYHADGNEQRLDDLSAAARTKRSAYLHDFAKRLAALNHHLSPEDAADAALLADGVALELLELDEAHDYTRRSDEPLDALGNVFFQMAVRDYAPLEQRATDVLLRLAAVPQYLEQARAGLTTNVPVFHEAAKDDGDGLIEYFEKDLTNAFAKSTNAAKINAAAKSAAAAVRAYLVFVDGELAKKPATSFRYGAALYGKRFRPYLQTDLTPDQVLAAARARVPLIHAEMAKLAKQIVPNLPPKTNDMELIRAALAKVAEDHAAPAELFESVRKSLHETQAFVRDKGLLTLESRDNLRIVETPPFLRSQLGVAAFDGAPPLSPSQGAFYYVTPFPSEWPKEKTASKLREYNRSMLDILTIHEAMPGHYVQFERANNVQPETRRVLRWVLGAGSYIEGWAVYIQDVMVDAGFRGNDPRLRLTNLKMELRAVINSIIDIELQAHELGDQAALDLMLNDGFQERTEAEAKLRRAKLSVTQLCSYFVGLQAWRSLRADAEKRPGFSLRAFHDRAIAEGAVTLPTLKTLVH